MLRYVILMMFTLIFINQGISQLNFSINKKEIPAPFQEMDKKILEGKYENITSVLVAQNGQLVYEKYYNGRDVNSKHNTRSVTKTMATLLAGIAFDKGYIKSEKDPIYTYLQHKMPVRNPDDRKTKISIEDLLTMSSILECSDDNQFSRGHEERMYIIEDWTQFLLDLPVRFYPWGPKPAALPYGRSFSYCSAGAAALSEIIQTAIKQPLDAFAKKNLFDPLEISDYKLNYTPMRILNTAGGSEYRSRDFLKIIQMCLNGGRWKSQKIISSVWLNKATNPKANAYDDVDYGYLFWLKKFGKEKKYQAYYMSGNGGNKVLAIPELQLTVVITATNYGNRNAHNYTDEIMNEYVVPAVLK